jgi:hypothetical protein
VNGIRRFTRDEQGAHEKEYPPFGSTLAARHSLTLR